MRENSKAHLITRPGNDDNLVQLRPRVCAPFTPDAYARRYHISGKPGHGRKMGEKTAENHKDVLSSH
jgi:hypothetical protein